MHSLTNIALPPHFPGSGGLANGGQAPPSWGRASLMPAARLPPTDRSSRVMDFHAPSCGFSRTSRYGAKRPRVESACDEQRTPTTDSTPARRPWHVNCLHKRVEHLADLEVWS